MKKNRKAKNAYGGRRMRFCFGYCSDLNLFMSAAASRISFFNAQKHVCERHACSGCLLFPDFPLGDPVADDPDPENAY
ncbi:MAG: hypothetical protein ACI33O_13790, partial [Bhargavaea sp.]